MEKSKMIRIKDIAKLCGVSVGTVDRVIHKRGKVSDEALKKVEKVLQEIDYTPNLLAKTLGSNKIFNVSILVPHPNQDPYWKLCIAGLEASIEEWKPYNIELKSHFFELHNSNLFKEVAQKLLESEPDAVLSAPIFYKEALEVFRKLDVLKIPYIHFNTQIPSVRPLAFIGQDLYQSGWLGASLLDLSTKGQKGTLSIFHVSENIKHSTHFKEKERGFRDYFDAKNATDRIISSIIIEENNMDSLERSLVGAIAREGTIGLFIPTSSGAKITAEIIRKNGINNICIVGYDLLEENVKLLKAGEIDFLINQNPDRQVFRGVHHLANHLIFNKQIPEQELFPLEVITRDNVDSYIKFSIQ